MQTSPSRFALIFSSLAIVLGVIACGGGADEGPDGTSASASHADRDAAQARRRPPPPPPPPAPTLDATLALASATAAGQAVHGAICAVSGDGGKVLFTSAAAALGSSRPSGQDIFLKDFNGNGVTRAVTTLSRSLGCLGMTPDAHMVVFAADAPDGVPDYLGREGLEPAILVQNQRTGQQTRVTPLRSSLPNVDAFQFAGISDDGLRVAFIAQPTRTCSGYDCRALGPARMLMRDLATGQLINLESQVRFTTSQGFADGNAWLSPDGRTLAFSSRAAYPQAGDTTPGSDVYAFDVASGSVRLVSTDAAGRQLTFPGFQGVGPTFGVQTFLAQSGRIAFYADNDTSVGPGGVYVKDLATGALDRVLDRSLTSSDGRRANLSFSDDGRKVAYVTSTGNTLTGRSLPTVRDVASGAVLNPATLTNGTAGNGNTTVSALLSRDGRFAAFDHNATNLLGGVSALGGAELRAYRKLLP